MKIGRNQPCPCGSGKKFKHCCYGKAYTIVDEDETSYTTELPIGDEMAGLLERSAEEFERHFGRRPGSSDPLFLMKYSMSDSDVERLTVEAMERTGMDPAKIYAYRKTGRLLGEDYLNNYPDHVIAEWDAAISEYDELGDAKANESAAFDHKLEDLQQTFESMLYAFGLANDKFFNAGLLEEPAEHQAMSTGQYQALCLSRVHRSLRSIQVLTKEHLSEDALKLARSIYESYLHVKFAASDPSAVAVLVDVPLGLRTGSLAYKKRTNGTEDKRWVVNPKTGEEYPGHIAAYKMAASSDVSSDLPFFDFFYSATSEFIHPSVFAFDGYFSEHGLDPVKPHMHEESVIFTACVSAMSLDLVRTISGCPPEVEADCTSVVCRVKGLLLELLGHLSTWQERLGASLESVTVVQSRCEQLAEQSM